MYVCMYVCLYLCMDGCTNTSMYFLYVGFHYTYIDINALAQRFKLFLVSQVLLQAVSGARTYGIDLLAITSQPR